MSRTGHIVYNGWSAMPLGWQLYLGALFIKLFGFSFAAVRISILTVSIVTVALMQRLFVRFGISEWNATIATLTIGLSPLFLPLAFSFMSDVPGFFCLAICLYGCVRAVEAETDRAALGWLAFAAISNVAGGTARQIVWLGALVIVPSTAWWMRRRKNALVAGTALWLLSAGAIAACMHWFSAQPYTVSESLLTKSLGWEWLVEIRSVIVRNLLAICGFLLPILIAFLLRYPFGNRRARVRAAAAGGLYVAAVIFLVARHRPVYWLAPFTDNYITEKGLLDVTGILGQHPGGFPFGVRVALTALTFAAAIGFLLCVWNARDEVRGTENHARKVNFPISWNAVFTMLAPFALAYFLLLVTRSNVYDRYLLPLLFVALVFVLRFYEQEISDRLPLSSVALMIVFAAYGVMAMHDLFATDRARLKAANEVAAAGVARTEIEAGLEYDAWTQLETAGYVNNRRINNPAGIYQRRKRPANVSAVCYEWFLDLTPTVQPRYALSYDQSTCYTPSQFGAVSYTAWLSPHHREIYVQKVPR